MAKIELSWGNGESDLFLLAEKEGFSLLDYEFDNEIIHKMCGGKCYYTSNSGCSGNGFIKTMGTLIKVGSYRVDTKFYDWQRPVEIADGITIMFPYASHAEDKSRILNQYPVVVVQNQSTVIYCKYDSNMNDVLRKVVLGDDLEKKPKLLKRNFVNTVTPWNRETTEKLLTFYNFFGGRSINPWVFAGEWLKDSLVHDQYESERIHNIFGIAKLSYGTWVKTARIDSARYAVEIIEGDPCENLEQALPGWEFLEQNMLYKYRENTAYIVGWKNYRTECEKRINKLYSMVPENEKENFKNFIFENISTCKYVEFELEVPKLAVLMDKERYVSEIHKGIAKKVTDDVIYEARRFVDKFNDAELVEMIPDDYIIKFEDSLNAGNCLPGTQHFVEKYFPGLTEVSAKELKKHWTNMHVMRIFKFIAKKEGFAADTSDTLENVIDDEVVEF